MMSDGSSRSEMFAGGPLAFPVTRRGSRRADLPAFKQHIARLLDHEPPRGVVACGTGELASLDQDEVAALVRAAVEVAGSTVPVIAGAGQGFKVAQGMIKAAESAGASGFLVLPPYLVTGEQEGLFEYFRALAASTALPLILYQRDNVRLEPATVERLAAVSNIVGLKDGLGDVELMQRIITTVGRGSLLQRHADSGDVPGRLRRAEGPAYSSAVFISC